MRWLHSWSLPTNKALLSIETTLALVMYDSAMETHEESCYKL